MPRQCGSIFAHWASVSTNRSIQSLNHAHRDRGNLEASVRSRGTDLAAHSERDLIEAGLNEAAVGPALWAEYAGALAATAIVVGDLLRLGARVDGRSGCVGAGIGVGRAPDVIGRAVIDG